VSRPWTRWLAGFGLILFTVAFWLLVLARFYSSPIASYSVVDERTIVVQAASGPRTWTWISNVTETPSDVTVSVQSLEWLRLPGTAIGKDAELTVHLVHPLEDRVVRDGEGTRIPLRTCRDGGCQTLPVP
jgi:hypothetical protein